MGKGRYSFRKSSRRSKKGLSHPSPSVPGQLALSSPPSLAAAAAANNLITGGVKAKKKGIGAATRLWMRFDNLGHSELVECDKSTIIKRAAIPARDLRILGPFFSQSSNILAREKAMVINLEFIRTIVTAEEVLILDPLRHEVLPFVDRLRQQLTPKSPFRIQTECKRDPQESETHISGSRKWQHVESAADSLQSELAFEFQVLEIALEVVCTYMDSSVDDLERDAYPILDELAMNVSTKNLERVRSLKSNLTHLLARVQKVRDEIEQLLDDDDDMADMYLSRKHVQIQQMEDLITSAASNTAGCLPFTLPFLDSIRSTSQVPGSLDKNDVEDLEMLLEYYFMQLDKTRNKILSVREYIDDTEDYVNIRLDNQRNELIQFQLTLTIASFAIAMETLITAIFGMNIPCYLYNVRGIFGFFVGGASAGCFLLFLLILGYARRKKLLGS